MSGIADTRVRQHGFTLVELVIAICIAMIVAAFVVMFIRTPVENYMAQSRRAELINEADLIERNLANDIRNAVPNSIRIPPGNSQLIELLYAVDIVSYRQAGTSSPPAPNDELDVTVPDSRFSTLGRFDNNVSLPCCVAQRYRVVVNQDQSIAGQDAYKGDRSITSSATNILVQRPGPAAGSDWVRMNPAFKFALPSPRHHAFLVSGPVAYECDIAAHTLKRYANYAISSGIAANRGTVAASTISNDVSTCSFISSPSTSSRGDLVTINIQLTRAGETQTVFLQKAVENLP